MSNLSKTDIWYREEYLPFVDSHLKGVARCDTWDSYKEACIKRDEEIDKLKKQNEIYREALEFYADSDNEYFIESTKIVNDVKVHTMKSIIAISKLAIKALKDKENI